MGDFSFKNSIENCKFWRKSNDSVLNILNLELLIVYPNGAAW
jgi:hypothetical protein